MYQTIENQNTNIIMNQNVNIAGHSSTNYNPNVINIESSHNKIYSSPPKLKNSGGVSAGSMSKICELARKLADNKK
jgi:hypothetical protein